MIVSLSSARGQGDRWPVSRALAHEVGGGGVERGLVLGPNLRHEPSFVMSFVMSFLAARSVRLAMALGVPTGILPELRVQARSSTMALSGPLGL